MAMNESGQMILIFSAAVVVIVLSLSYIYAQNLIAGMESSRTMLAFPKEEIRNLMEICQNADDEVEVQEQIAILCAKNGWICYVSKDKVEFKNSEVEFCDGKGC